MKSTVAKASESDRVWYLVDAADRSAGRLAVEIANILRGRNKTAYTPHVDTGDFVVVVNAEKVKLTGRKEEQKIYQDYSGYRGGLKEKNAATVREKHPERIIKGAVKGMLPKNRISRTMFGRLKVYVGPGHPHAAQNPQKVELLEKN